MSNLECGFSQKLLADLGQTDPNFLVVLTDRGGNKDLSRMLYNEWVGLKERKMKTDDNNQNDDVVQLDFHIPFSVYISFSEISLTFTRFLDTWKGTIGRGRVRKIPRK